MTSLNIKSKIKDYKVFFESDYNFLKQIATTPNSSLIIDGNVYELYKKVIDEHFNIDDAFILEAIEENKNIEYASKMYQFFTSKNAKKNMTIISIGGGITQDITGFVASTLYRGVKWIYVPTTFLAQTDSCIGSKTSLNFESFKNLLGTFYPPNEIYINTDFLKTLSKVDFYSGVGETIKLLIMDEKGRNLEEIKEITKQVTSEGSEFLDTIKENLAVKQSYMENDEFDQGRRNLLNYGHCFGHALETTSNYEVPHGIAINIGMIFANLLSVNRGLLSADLVEKYNLELHCPNIPLALKKEHFSKEALLKCIKNDKKRTGKDLAVVILDNKLKLQRFNDVTEEEFEGTLRDLVNILF